METIGIFVVIVLFVGLWVLYFVLMARGNQMNSNFKRIKVGMTYDEVIKIVGVPTERTEHDGVVTCKWNKTVQRMSGGYPSRLTHAVVFKDNKVVSVV